MNTLQTKYEKEIKKALTAKFSYSSPMQIPRLEKIVINMGTGKDVGNSKAVEEVLRDLGLIAGQKAIPTIAKKSLASWKLREGMQMGAKVTLRRDNMWNFLQKIITIVIPRVHDFRGLSTKSFDGRGNFAMGIKDHIIFPEISFDKSQKSRGLDILIVTTAQSDEESRELLTLMGMPFRATK